jgi:hypothetical protein
MALEARKEKYDVLFVRLDVLKGSCTPYVFHFWILKNPHLVHLIILITSDISTFFSMNPW